MTLVLWALLSPGLIGVGFDGASEEDTPDSSETGLTLNGDDGDNTIEAGSLGDLFDGGAGNDLFCMSGAESFLEFGAPDNYAAEFNVLTFAEMRI